MPLFGAKLSVPPVRGDLVTRPRLIERLDAAVDHKLTLISAPAGFGKTTLLADWALGSAMPVAWLSVDEGDNDPARFMLYVVAALRKLEPGIGENASALLCSPEAGPTELILATLINELDEISYDFALVLDDYNLLQAEPVHRAVAFLLNNLPPRMHLIISGRADPPLPLSGMLARGQLNRLSAGELRFMPGEAAAFLEGAMGEAPSAADVRALEARTEGWITGLRLAALSVRGGEEIGSFVASFTGEHRYVFGYFAQEILERQPEGIRDFLMRTSVLERATGPLCDALMGEGGGQEMLEEIERSNLFLVALDDERRWYRYHHLFSGFLRRRLEETRPELVPELHRRACSWYESNGFTDEAVKHALAAGDDERAADLVERVARSMLRRSELTTLLGWLGALPEGVVRSRPRLCLFHAWVSLATGRLDDADLHLRRAERALDGAADSRGWGPACDPPGSAANPNVAEVLGEAAAIRGAVASMRGDVSRAMRYSREALELLTEENQFLRSITAGALGIAYRANGDDDAAVRAFEEAISISRANGATYVSMLAYGLKAEVRRSQGRLQEACEAYREALSTVEPRDGRRLPPAAGVAFVGIGETLREWNDLDDAARHLAQGIELGERGGDIETVLAGHVALARVNQARKDHAGATGLLREARRLAQRYGKAEAADRIGTWQARLWLAQDNRWAAAQWLRGRPVEDGLEPSRELEYLTSARVLILLGRQEEALSLLSCVREMAQTAGRNGSLVEVLLLEALALQSSGDTPEATDALRRALVLAEPSGYVRLFLDEGPPIAALLRNVYEEREAGKPAYGGGSTEYAGRLLAALGDDPGRGARGEGLSQRELEILRLLASGVSNRGIADGLLVSPNTVKSHLKNLYCKLGVHSRTQAIARAGELDLLQPRTPE